MKLIIKELIALILKAMYPVGTIYMSVNSANPSTYIGGTWVAWGSGRVPVGVNTSDSSFNSVEKTGGVKEIALSACIGACNNGASSLGYIAEEHNGYQAGHNATYIVYGSTYTTSFSNWNHSTPVVDANGGNNRNTTNLQPYITCYMWKRTA